MKLLAILITALFVNYDVFTQGILELKHSSTDVGIAIVGTPLSRTEKDFIRNTGQIARTIDSVYLTGEHVEYFGVTLHNPKVIPPKGSADITISFAPKHIGTFWVEIVFISGVDTIRGDIRGYAIKINDATSVEEGKDLLSTSTDNLILYPNPSNEFASIYCKSFETARTTLEVVSPTGEIILTYIDESGESIKKGNYKLDISSLPNGVYSVFCKTLNNVYSSKLTIMH